MGGGVMNSDYESEELLSLDESESSNEDGFIACWIKLVLTELIELIACWIKSLLAELNYYLLN